MKLTNGQELPVSGELVGYDGHKNKSSRIAVIAGHGVLRKEKKRSKQKAVHELLALSAWNRLLDAHNQQTTDAGLHVTAPAPYGLDEQGRLYMEFLPGVSADSALPGNYARGKDAPTRAESRLDLSRKLGRLLKIKEIENLAHYDFQLRHLIHDINLGTLSVIDVENSCVDRQRVAEEHLAILAQVDRTFAQSDRIRKKVKDAIEEGYESPLDDYSILPDIAEQLRTELGFNEKAVARFTRSR